MNGWISRVLSPVFCLCLASQILRAAEVTAIVTPEQIVREALAHGPRLRILDKEIVAAGARFDQARAQGWPHLGADAKAASYTGPEDSRLGPGFSIPFIENRYGAGVTVSQPLYLGGKARGARDAARHQKGAAEADRRGAEADLVLQSLAGYWDWSKAHALVASLQAAVARMERHATDMRNLRQAGLATETESLATEVQLDQTRLRQEEARRRLDLAQARIRFLTGRALPENSTPLSPAVRPDLPLPTEGELLAWAWTNRAERAARRTELRAVEAQVKISRAEHRPQISLVARYEQARPNLLSIPPEDRWQDDAFVGVTMSWSLFDFGLTKAKVTEAAARVDQAKARLEQTDEEIALQVREARCNLQTARNRVRVAARAEESASRNLDAATHLWRSGLTRHVEVLDAHAKLTDTEYEVTAARADLEVARAALEHAVGRLDAEFAGAGTSGPPQP